MNFEALENLILVGENRYVQSSKQNADVDSLSIYTRYISAKFYMDNSG